MKARILFSATAAPRPERRPTTSIKDDTDYRDATRRIDAQRGSYGLALLGLRRVERSSPRS